MGTGSGRWVVKRDVELVELVELDLLDEVAEVELVELDLLDEVAEVDVRVSFGLPFDLG